MVQDLSSTCTLHMFLLCISVGQKDTQHALDAAFTSLLRVMLSLCNNPLRLGNLAISANVGTCSDVAPSTFAVRCFRALLLFPALPQILLAPLHLILRIRCTLAFRFPCSPYGSMNACYSRFPFMLLVWTVLPCTAFHVQCNTGACNLMYEGFIVANSQVYIIFHSLRHRDCTCRTLVYSCH